MEFNLLGPWVAKLLLSIVSLVRNTTVHTKGASTTNKSIRRAIEEYVVCIAIVSCAHEI